MGRLLLVATALLAFVCSIEAELTEFQHARQYVDWFIENHFDASIEEFEERFATFRANVDFIIRHNERYAKGEESYWVGLNQYADLTFEEYSSVVLGYRSSNATSNNVTDIASIERGEYNRVRIDRRSRPGPRFNPWQWLCKRFRWAWWACAAEQSSSSSTGSAGLSSSSGVADLSSSSSASYIPDEQPVLLSSSSSGPSLSSSSAPPAVMSSSSTGPELLPPSSSSTGVAQVNETFVDWRESGFVGPVKNQGTCAASNVFAAASALESAWAQHNNEFVALSTQQLLDCANAGNCSTGGSLDDIWSYVFNTTSVSIVNGTSYPFVGFNSECSANNTGANFTSIAQVPSADEAALLEASRVVPSIATGFHAASQGWQFYAGGVFSDSTCNNSTAALNHAVNIVGFGTHVVTGQDYWLVQNSVGLIWGRLGFAKVARGSNMCGIATEASYVVV